MLFKLVKYDLKAMSKELSIIAIITVVASFLSAIIVNININNTFFEIFKALVTLTAAFGILALSVMTFFVTIKRFYVNVLKDQGYLSNTLPVSKTDIVLSKLISSGIISLVSGIVIYICGGFASGDINGFFIELIRDLGKGIDMLGGYSIPFGIGMIVLIILGSASAQSAIYMCLSLGFAKDRNKLLFSVIYAILTYVVFVIFMTIVFMLVSSIDVNINLQHISEPLAATIIIWVFVIFALLYLSLFTYITQRTLTNKLNLE